VIPVEYAPRLVTLHDEKRDCEKHGKIHCERNYAAFMTRTW
jgi:hypothetical protein